MDALIYTRVSTDQQEANTSLLTQLEACQRYCAERGYAVVGIFQDSASGATLDRPGMDALRERLPDAEVVVAYAVDRLSRDQNHIGILFDAFQRHKARLELVTEAFEDTAVGRFIIAARAFVGEVEREKIRERTSRGRARRAAEGSFIGAHPYGYRRIARGVIEVDEAQAAVVRRIYDLYLQNVGMRAIAERLNAEGARTRRGMLWTPKEVRDALINETYSGVMTYSGQRYPDFAPVIIEREAWERVQERMRRKSMLPAGRTQVSPYLLTGLLHCGECGGRMVGVTRVTRRGGHVYPYRVYECLNYRRGRGCAPTRHKADPLEARVLELLDEMAGGVAPLAERRTDRLDQERVKVERALRENEAERERVAAAIARGLYASDEQARRANRDVEDARQRLVSEQARITAAIADLAVMEARAAQMPGALRSIIDGAGTIPERKQTLQTYLTKITVWDENPEPYLE
jgi:site-specific DNA recombinase